MNKKIKNKNHSHTQPDNQARETKILNILCNTSILLMSLMTEAFTDAFTNLSKEMITTMTTGLGAPPNTKNEIQREINQLNIELPKQLREQLLTMKTEITTQLHEKKETLASVIVDKKFDEGIAIVERYTFNLPKLSGDLNEHALFGYIALLKENNKQVTTMFQELVEWMKHLPQPT
jgi:hypothetical protein